MRRHRSTVWRVCWRYARREGLKSSGLWIGNRDDRKARAGDLAQEVWIVLWLKFDQLDLSDAARNTSTTSKNNKIVNNL